MTATALQITLLPSTIISTFNMGGNDLSQFQRGCLQLNFVPGTSTGSVQLQLSANGDVYANSPISAVAFTGSTTTALIELPNINAMFYRLAFTLTGGAGTTVTVLGHFIREY